LNGDGNDAEHAAQRPRHDTAPKQLKKRKRSVVGVGHGIQSNTYSSTAKLRGSKMQMGLMCKKNAERRKKYFWQIKFSTQVLISMWKTRRKAR
jgi:hypothetical protein